MSNSPQPGVWNSIKPFVFGGIAGICATSVVQPVDTIKVRIQIMGESSKNRQVPGPLLVARDIIEKEGFRSLYRGLDSAYVRQCTYGTTRLGVYKTLFAWRHEKNGQVGFFEKVGITLFAGFIGSMVGNPADLTLTRFQADQTLPLGERRNYADFGDAFKRILKDEGVLGLWKGAGPTIARAMLMNCSQLATFEELKEQLTKLRGTPKNDTTTSVIASIGSGIVMSVVALPADNIKTKLQKMSKLPDGSYPYTGMIDCLKKSIANEGVVGLWVGLPTFIVRIAPHSIVTLLVLDSLYSKWPLATGK